MSVRSKMNLFATLVVVTGLLAAWYVLLPGGKGAGSGDPDMQTLTLTVTFSPTPRAQPVAVAYVVGDGGLQHDTVRESPWSRRYTVKRGTPVAVGARQDVPGTLSCGIKEGPATVLDIDVNAERNYVTCSVPHQVNIWN